MRIEGMLSRCQFGQRCDCRLEMGGITREISTRDGVQQTVSISARSAKGVIVETVTCICDTSLTSLTPVLLVISAASALYLIHRERNHPASQTQSMHTMSRCRSIDAPG